MDLYERFKSAANEIQRNFPITGKRALVLGSKLQSLLKFNSEKFVTYSSLAGLNDIGLKGGGFYTEYADNSLFIMTLPLFDDDSTVDVRLRATGVRLLQILGMTELFLLGMGESLNKDDSGELMFLAEDHINLSGVNPLVGANIDEFGARFPDMTAVYDAELTSIGKTESENAGFQVENGVWAAFDGDHNRLDEFSESLIKNSVHYFSDELISESIAAAHGNIKLSLSLLINPSEEVSEKLRRLIGQLIPKSN